MGVFLEVLTYQNGINARILLFVKHHACERGFQLCAPHAAAPEHNHLLPLRPASAPSAFNSARSALILSPAQTSSCI